MVPIAEVITQPFAHISSSTGKCGSSDDQRPSGWTTSEHGGTSKARHHSAIQVVCIIFDKAVGVLRVGLIAFVSRRIGMIKNRAYRSRFTRKSTGRVVDSVRRVEHVLIS